MATDTLSFHGAGNKASVLVMHGFTGTPFDVMPLANELHAKGFEVHVPLLTGHHAGVDALNNTRAEDWIGDADNSWRALPRNKPRIVAGFSMGGLLACLLAQKYPRDVDALLLLAPAFHLRLDGAVVGFAARHGLWRILKSFPKSERGGDVGDENMRRQNPTGTEVPVKGLKEFERLRLKTLAEVTELGAPVWSAFGGRDHVINAKKCARVVHRISRNLVGEVWFPHSQHLLIIDKERDEVCLRALQFCEQINAAKSRSA